MQISINQLLVKVCLGVFPHEIAKRRKLIIDIDLFPNYTINYFRENNYTINDETNTLENIIDYDRVVSLITKALECEKQFHLMEDILLLIIDIIENNFAQYLSHFSIKLTKVIAGVEGYDAVISHHSKSQE